ncbi:MAG: thioredoxin [Capsulimonadaceae bacterium]
MSAAAAVSTADFDKEVLESDVPVLVDFWAVWCAPCRLIAPYVDAVAEELGGKAKVYKLNVDENGEIAARYNVMSIPTLIIFKGGQKVDQLVGGQNTKQTIGDALRRQIG